MSLSTSCTQLEQPQSAAELLELGEKYLLELSFEQALVRFLRVVEIEPMIPRGYTGAAEAYIGMGQSDNAVAILEQGLLIINSDESIQALLAGLRDDKGYTIPSPEDAQGMIQTETEEEPPEEQLSVEVKEIVNQLWTAFAMEDRGTVFVLLHEQALISHLQYVGRIQGENRSIGYSTEQGPTAKYALTGDFDNGSVITAIGYNDAESIMQSNWYKVDMVDGAGNGKYESWFIQRSGYWEQCYGTVVNGGFQGRVDYEFSNGSKGYKTYNDGYVQPIGPASEEEDGEWYPIIQYDDGRIGYLPAYALQTRHPFAD